MTEQKNLYIQKDYLFICKISILAEEEPLETRNEIRVPDVILRCLVKSFFGLTANWSGFAVTESTADKKIFSILLCGIWYVPPWIKNIDMSESKGRSRYILYLYSISSESGRTFQGICQPPLKKKKMVRPHNKNLTISDSSY